MSLISVENLTFCYPGSYDNVFENVSLSLDTAWKLGFIGRNGRGKTTFLKLLASEYEYGGRITASVYFEYFPYPVADKGLPAEAVVARICPGYASWALRRELNLLQMDEAAIGQSYATLSKGEQTKLLLAALFLRENSFLLIDEPTNHLDIQAREVLADYLRTKSGYILVSHDRAFLDACVDHILTINRTDIEVQSGNFSTWYRNRKRQDEFELEQNHKLKKEIKRLEGAARQSSRWADKVESTKIGGLDAEQKSMGGRAYIGEQSRRMQKRRKNLERRQQEAIEEKAKLLKNLEKADALKLFPAQYGAGRLLELKEVSLFYGERRVCDRLSFEIKSGDRLAITGKNGSGKSSIIKLICGGEVEYRGDFYKAPGLIISHVAQDVSFLGGSPEDFAREQGIDFTLFLTILRKLDLPRAQFEKEMESYSAGQKKKALLAASLCKQAHLYIWDEPLNYIDLLSRIQIEALIKEYRPTMLFVEHDAAFCDAVATKRLNL